ncbi:aldolase/citrate lyase family protein [Amycolatopsis rifamycinica]|uniref:Uncharacterized protein n=1 Tax=Amycolatopsis rifamycinica TaxID=287986 RepID=A0A066TUK5_9PSEU|nr:aldolase/citrate lyase family protein [Amycolatopsis rifamycinica]KDN18555.1 hypothetical protein DV20_28595 [Amycolatopsis rifamycinica]
MATTTFLFVPGDRPERFAKAAAGVVVLDLEDAVAAEAEDSARAGLVAARAVPVMVPKAETAGVLSGFREVVAFVETARGMEAAGEPGGVPSVRRGSAPGPGTSWGE